MMKRKVCLNSSDDSTGDNMMLCIARHRTRTLRFTLIELLVVVSIIAILAAMLLPALMRAKYQAVNLMCINHVRQLTVATMMYVGDANDLYPDRGSWLADPGDFSSNVRWASRITYDGNKTVAQRYRSLGWLLNPYCPLDTPIWVCPLYQGTDKGDHVYGLKGKEGGGHTGSFTYSMHAGMKERTYGWKYGRRVRIGETYDITETSGTTHRLNILWTDGGPNHQNLWAPGLNFGGVGTYHKPPPGRAWAFTHTPALGDMRVFGTTVATYGYDDGSVTSKRLPIIGVSNQDFIVHQFQAGRAPYFPRD